MYGERSGRRCVRRRRRWGRRGRSRRPGRGAPHLGIAQSLHEEQGGPSFRPPHLGVDGLQAEGHPPVPHHALEIGFQVLAPGVVAARDVLGVVLAEFQAREDRRRQDTGGSLDVGQLGFDQVGGVVGDCDRGIEQPAR